MNDGLNELLRQRFASHEVPAPPDAWARISGSMAAHADGTGLREALQNKFKDHEARVDPSAWANISSRSGHAGAGSASTYGWIAAGIGALLIGGALLWNAQDAPTETRRAAVEQEVTTPKVEETPNVEEARTQPPVPAAKEVPEAKPATEAKPQVPKARATAPAVPVIGKKPLVEESANPAPSAVVKPMAKEDVAEQGQESTPAAAIPEEKEPVVAKEEVTVTPAPKAEEPVATPLASTPATTATPVAPTHDASQQPEIPEPMAAEDQLSIFIPNTLTVNSDNVNDKLVITASNYEAVDVRIVANNGALVFRSNDLSRMWDGRLPNGNVAQEGYYSCLVAITDLRGVVHYQPEVIRLIR